MSTTTEEESSRSPIPFSPFSDYVSVSEPTTDENPDLGQFNFVFRTLTHLQPHPWIPAFNGAYLAPSIPSLSSATERGGAIHDRIDGVYHAGGDGSGERDENLTAGRSENGGTMMVTIRAPEEETEMESMQQTVTVTSEIQNGSTVWHQQPILSYLDFSSSAHTRTPSELIVGQFGQLEDRDHLRFWQVSQRPVEEPQTESSGGPSGDEDEGDTDTEGGMTVEISSNDEDLEISIGSGSDSEEEEINPDAGDGEDEYDELGDGDGLVNGDIVTTHHHHPGIPSIWRSSPTLPRQRQHTSTSRALRPLLRPYSPAWDSEEQENADEFGPFDAATTASSGTRPMEDCSEYEPDSHLSPSGYGQLPATRSRSSTPFSMRDGRDDDHDDGAGSILTSRTSPPLESVAAHEDVISLPERPSSLPVDLHGGRSHRYVFSSPLNDNSTTARSSSISSFSSSLSSYPSASASSLSPCRPGSPESVHHSYWNPAGHLRSQSAQPHSYVSYTDHSSLLAGDPNPLRQFKQLHRRLGSGSGSISTDSTLTRTSGAHTGTEDTILGRPTSIFTHPIVPGSSSRQAVRYNDDNNSDTGPPSPPLRDRDSPFDSDGDLTLHQLPPRQRFPQSPFLSVDSSVSDQTIFSSADMRDTSQSQDDMNMREWYQESHHHIPNNSYGEVEPLPSLGLLDEALQFIAEERARWEALRDAGGTVSGGFSSDSERWKHELESSDSTPESNGFTGSSTITTTTRSISTSTSTASASDRMLLSPPHSKRSPRKKKQRKAPVTRVLGNETPIMPMSILRSDGTIIGGIRGGESVTNGNTDASIKRRSLGSDSHLGSGTLTPRIGGASRGLSAVQGGSVEIDEVDVTPRKKKGKEKPILPHSRSAPQMKVSFDITQGEPSEEGAGHRRARDKETAKEGKERKAPHASVNPKTNTARAQTHAVNTKRARLQGLAKQLKELFPEDKRHLDRVLKSLEHQRKGKKGKRAVRKSNEEAEEEGEDLDPRARPPRTGDPLVHVFIDHSNILFGLLTHLKRHPPRRPLPPTPTSIVATLGYLRPASTVLAAPSTISTDSTTASTASPLLGTVIPLPSFATARTTQAGLGRKEKSSGDTTDFEITGSKSAASASEFGVAVGTSRAAKRRVRHLSHSALTLILERGRAVTRRVLVASSPLYQPIDGMERLGYQVSIFLRVPDLGDGMDKDRNRDRSLKRLSGSGYGSSSGSGPGPGISIPNKKKAHVKHGSSGGAGDLLGVGGSGGSASAPSSYTSSAHFDNAMLARQNAAVAGTSVNGSVTSPGNTGTPTQRIRFREQGVDELLQLKLHQALAAEDDVPEGATIVLATGDGNVGQFNEEGFLGPVRTALKRGWKVELYSWEGGLSRAWKREFGEESEWGKTGMFNVIGMEQFASSLVEDGWV